MLAALFPQQMIDALMREVETHACDVVPDVLIEQLDQLARVEEILVANAIADGAADVQRSPNAPPAALLGVRIAKKGSRAA
jgi:hypothetical protein